MSRRLQYVNYSVSRGMRLHTNAPPVWCLPRLLASSSLSRRYERLPHSALTRAADTADVPHHFRPRAPGKKQKNALSPPKKTSESSAAFSFRCSGRCAMCESKKYHKHAPFSRDCKHCKQWWRCLRRVYKLNRRELRLRLSVNSGLSINLVDNCPPKARVYFLFCSSRPSACSLVDPQSKCPIRSTRRIHRGAIRQQSL